jgi:putative cell wall-binding protein
VGQAVITATTADGGFVKTCSVTVTAEKQAVEVSRLAGTNRNQTAALASRRAFPDAAVVNTVIVATADNFPDALAASYLAGVTRSPILLCPKAKLDSYSRAEIIRLAPSTIYIVGGVGAVSSNVYGQLVQLPSRPKVTRIGGNTRFETALNIAKTAIGLQAVLYGTRPTEVFIATGESFPDALAVSPFAVSRKIPVLTIPKTGITYQVKQFITSQRIQTINILGGTGAVPASSENNLASAYGRANVHRLGGNNRYQTAANIVNGLLSRYRMQPGVVAVTTGDSFPDALSGGASLGARGGVVILTPTKSLDGAARSTLVSLMGANPEVEILGGKAAVSTNVESLVKTIVAK